MAATEACPTVLERARRFLISHLVPLGIGTVGCAFGIIAVSLGYKSLDEARLANRWAYLSYELALVEARMSLMAMCAQTPQVDETTCAVLATWEYLPSVLVLLHPPGGPSLAAKVQGSPRAQRLYSDTAMPVAGIAAVAILVPLVTLAAVALAASWSMWGYMCTR